MLGRIEKLTQKLSEIDDLVPMAMKVNHKSLHNFVLQKCKEQTVEFSKKLKRKGNTPKINKLKQELTSVINEGGHNSDKILSIKSQIQQLVEEDLIQVLQHRKTFSILKDERPRKSFLDFNEVIMIKKENPNSNPTIEENETNPRSTTVTD